MGPQRQESLCTALENDPASADTGPAEAAMLRYVVRLTVEPSNIARQDMDRLRAHGFDDRAIHDICCVASYYAFVNRIADGLGVGLEEDFQT